MAKMWFLVLVMMLFHDVSAVRVVCPAEENVKTCDECLRCGGTWCPIEKNPHCAYKITDTFCDGLPERRPRYEEYKSGGKILKPNFIVANAYVGRKESQDFEYTKPKNYGEVTAAVLNSTQNDEIEFTFSEPDCHNGMCQVTITAEPTRDYCSTNFTINEITYAQVQVENVNETLLIEYHVPCVCNCSKDLVPSALQCSSHGDFVCGICSCHEGWCGKKCETKVEPKSERCNKNGNNECGKCKCDEGWWGEYCHLSCNDKERKSPLCSGRGTFSCGTCDCHEGWQGSTCGFNNPDFECQEKEDHGDVPCHNDNPLYKTECFGNGYCSNKCNKCKCYKDMPNSRYFDKKFCSDICLDTSDCQFCITNGKMGQCTSPAEDHCPHNITMVAYNETIAQAEDQEGKIWLPCNITFKSHGSECYVEYVAMKNATGISIMVIRSCNDYFAAPATDSSAKVPVILGVLFLLAALVAVGGYMAWKHFGKAPAPYFNVGDETNVDGENCVGENPLYRPPTSTFTNPQFGKC